MALNDSYVALRVDGPTGAVKGGYSLFEPLKIHNTITLTLSSGAPPMTILQGPGYFNRYVKTIKGDRKAPFEGNTGKGTVRWPITPIPKAITNDAYQTGYEYGSHVIFVAAVNSTGFNHWIIGQIGSKTDTV